ncbi:cutinase family protein, partial [Streptomyces mirabilis]|uniref:cutinase family protein n=1 Tax=Streptomyces mirabilis TaxID=68239 RepID=UPI0033CB231F
APPDTHTAEPPAQVAPPDTHTAEPPAQVAPPDTHTAEPPAQVAPPPTHTTQTTPSVAPPPTHTTQTTPSVAPPPTHTTQTTPSVAPSPTMKVPTPHVAPPSASTSTSVPPSVLGESTGPHQETCSTTHTVVSGDRLSAIALNYLGDANRWTEIYDATKSVIENAAKAHPRSPVFGASDHGHWIFPGTTLPIPGKACAGTAPKKTPSAPKTSEATAALCGTEPTFLLAARGSGEPGEAKFPGSHNLGGTPAKPKKRGRHATPAKPSALSLLYQRLNRPAGSAGVYGVTYDAIGPIAFYGKSDFESKSPKVPESTTAGAKHLRDEILKHAACNQKILLAGYSQGAVVVREAVNMLPPDIQDKISGIALFADPVSLAGARIGAKLPRDLAQRTISQCNEFDPICDTRLPKDDRRTSALLECGVLGNFPGSCKHFSYSTGSVTRAVVKLSKLPKR